MPPKAPAPFRGLSRRRRYNYSVFLLKSTPRNAADDLSCYCRSGGRGSEQFRDGFDGENDKIKAENTREEPHQHRAERATIVQHS